MLCLTSFISLFRAATVLGLSLTNNLYKALIFSEWNQTYIRLSIYRILLVIGTSWISFFKISYTLSMGFLSGKLPSHGSRFKWRTQGEGSCARAPFPQKTVEGDSAAMIVHVTAACSCRKLTLWTLDLQKQKSSLLYILARFRPPPTLISKKRSTLRIPAQLEALCSLFADFQKRCCPLSRNFCVRPWPKTSLNIRSNSV